MSKVTSCSQYCAPFANGLRSQTQTWVAQLAPGAYALPNNTFRVRGGAAKAGLLKVNKVIGSMRKDETEHTAKQ